MSPLVPKRSTPATLLVAARSAMLASDLDGAQARARQAETLAEAVGDQLMRARAVALVARVLHLRNEMADALTQALRAITLCEEVDDLASAVQAHEVAARIFLDIGDMAAALEEGLAATRAAEASGDLAASVSALRAMTNIYAALRQWDTALEFGDNYCKAAQLLGNPADECVALATLAYVYAAMSSDAIDRGDTEQAQAWGEQSVSLSRTAMLTSRKSGNRLTENTSLGNLAEMLSEIGRPEEGLHLLDSWTVDPALDTGKMIAHHREARGAILIGLGRFREAAELMALGVAEAPTRQYEISASRSLAMALEELGDLRGALDAHKRLFVLVTEQISEQAQRAASVAAVRLETVQAQAQAAMLRMQASDLQRTNDDLNRHSEDLRRQALEDPLTGLPNRRRLDQLLASDLRSCSLILLDVDHFKWVNDAHTHLVGDAVLRELGNILRANCRDTDTPTRFGGEEFALVMPGIPLDGALATAERVRAAVQNHGWQALSPGLKVTASFGVALGTEADTSIELLALADHRLLSAKALGRNRVVGPRENG
nr:GGDEF domain-containing protein [Kineosporia mesophila]